MYKVSYKSIVRGYALKILRGCALDRSDLPFCFSQERCSTEYENQCRTEYVTECQPNYAEGVDSTDCQSVPKEVCSQVAVPNCRQIADERVKDYNSIRKNAIEMFVLLSSAVKSRPENVEESRENNANRFQDITANRYLGLRPLIDFYLQSVVGLQVNEKGNLLNT